MAQHTLTQADLKELQQLKDEMKEKMSRFKEIMRRAPQLTYNRFHAYPEGHIEMNLDDDHNWAGKEMYTLQGIIDELIEMVDPNFQTEDGEGV